MCLKFCNHFFCIRHGSSQHQGNLLEEAGFQRAWVWCDLEDWNLLEETFGRSRASMSMDLIFSKGFTRILFWTSFSILLDHILQDSSWIKRCNAATFFSLRREDKTVDERCRISVANAVPTTWTMSRNSSERRCSPRLVALLVIAWPHTIWQPLMCRYCLQSDAVMWTLSIIAFPCIFSGSRQSRPRLRRESGWKLAEICQNTEPLCCKNLHIIWIWSQLRTLP